MSATTRRTFLSQATAASISATTLPLLAAGDKIYRTALIGSGWWGMNILREAIAHGHCQVVALCDVDATVLENGVADIESETGTDPKGYLDYRELLAEAKPEIVIIGTPDH